MKEMIYSTTRLNPPEMLADGEYDVTHWMPLPLAPKGEQK